MLKTRIATALALLTLFVPVILFAPPSGFAWLIALVVGCVAWEWARLLQLPGAWPVAYACLVMVVLAVVRANPAAPLVFGLLKAAVIFWLIAAPFALARQPALTRGAWRIFLLIAGFVIFLASGEALVYARARGTAFVISLLAVVWLADIGAYCAGTAWGRHKLAPAISPGKTWEGVMGGTALVGAAAVAALFSRVAAPTLFTDYADTFGIAGGLAVILLLVGTSVVGDLFESLLKRQAKVKDSSALLPGHGGVLDRVDALLPVLPLAMLLEVVSQMAARP